MKTDIEIKEKIKEIEILIDRLTFESKNCTLFIKGRIENECNTLKNDINTLKWVLQS